MNIKNIFCFLIASIVLSCQNPKSDKKIIPDTLSPTQPIEVATSDTIKSDSTQTDLSPSDFSINKKMLAEFYRKNKKNPQIFTVNNHRDTTLICSEKTKVTIKANSLVFSKTGKDISDKVKISIQEYYTISDILLARLSTTSNGDLLETGGMINITATSNNEECKLKKEKTVEIEFPRKTEKEGMQLYYGEWEKSGINWEVDKNSIDFNQIFSKVDKMPLFPEGANKMNEFISHNTKIPEDMDVNGRVLASIIIDKTGKATNPEIIRGFNKEVDDEVIKMLKKLPKFTPGKKNGITVNVKYIIPITIKTDDEFGDENNIASKKKFEEKYTNKNVKDAGASTITSYLFSSSKLGMINCDRLWKDSKSPAVDYAIQLSQNNQSSVNIIFHRYKSIMTRFSDSDNISFDNIPSEEKITIFAIKYINKEPFLAVKETKTSAKMENDLIFQPVSIESLKKEIKKLDRFN